MIVSSIYESVEEFFKEMESGNISANAPENMVSLITLNKPKDGEDFASLVKKSLEEEKNWGDFTLDLADDVKKSYVSETKKEYPLDIKDSL
jgi:hypothetical protein